MSVDDPVKRTAQAVVEDVTSVSWRQRLQTITLTVGVLAFGVALGIKWAAVTTINEIGPDPFGPTDPLILALAPQYNQMMTRMLVVAAVGLIVAVWLGTRE